MSHTIITRNTSCNGKNNYDVPHVKGSSQLFKQVQHKRLVFNICGEKYEVLQSTVQRYPKILLADQEKRAKFWDEERQEYYLDRNRACFESVLTYCQSNGILIRPPNVPGVLFLRELEFYELGEEVLQKIRGEDEFVKPERPMPSCKFQRQVWNLFEYPETSVAARFIAWLSCAVVLLSIVTFCVETLPEFQERDAAGKIKNYNVFFTIETICIAWFSVEYLTRLISSPHKWKFMKEALNVIDLVAILPYFMTLALSNESSNVSSMAIVRAVRLVRVFRILKLSRYSSGLQILGMTLKASLGELGLLVFFLTVGVVLFGSAIYYAEVNVEDGFFDSIPHSFWWAIVTMTTVGYGDMYPKTLVGKLIGCLCACTGILGIALPVPVIVANFERFYHKSQHQAEEDSPERHKKAAKHKALKRFFDRLRSRGSENNGTSRPEEYYHMGVSASEEVTASSEGISHVSPLIGKNSQVLCASSV